MLRSLLLIVALGAAMTAVAASAAAPHCPETAARACAPHHLFVAVPAPVRPLARPSSRATG